MHKYWKQIAAGSLAVMLATPVPIQAAIKKKHLCGRCCKYHSSRFKGK